MIFSFRIWNDPFEVPPMSDENYGTGQLGYSLQTISLGKQKHTFVSLIS